MSLALELANTPDQEPALAEWVRAAGSDPVETRALRSLRAAVREVLEAAAAGRQLPRDAVGALNAASAAAPSYARLENGELAYVLAASPNEAFLGDVAADAIELAGGPRRPLLRICRAPGCGRFFVASRPRQVWCSDTCGTRARVARSRAA